MAAGELTRCVLLSVASLAVGSAALRCALTLTPEGGLLAVLVAVTIGASGIVLEVLALGLVGAGGNGLALALAAGLTFTVSRLLPVAPVRLLDQLSAWWREASPPARWLLGGFTGLLLAWIAWNLAAPQLSGDGDYYHLPEMLAWVHNGHPGRQETVNLIFPVGSYPLTNEVLLTWALAISRSLAVVCVWGPVSLGILALGAWILQRELGFGVKPAALAVALLCSLPIIGTVAIDGTENDPVALAWLLCAGALAAAARRRLALLGPAAVAGGLAVGTKTTTVPYVLLLGVVVGLEHRHRFRAVAIPLVSGLIVAVAAGGVWYARDLIQHGSPVWPFAAAPWGDPVPPLLRTYTSFLSSPSRALQGNLAGYVTHLAGGAVAIGGAVLIAALRRSRALMLGAGVVAGGVLLWSLAPTSGPSTIPALSAVLSQTRYLLPVISAATIVLAYAGSGNGFAGWVARTLLGVGLTFNLMVDLVAGSTSDIPRVALLAGAATGVLVATVARTRWRAIGSYSRLGTRYLAVPVAVAAGLGLGIAANGFTARYAKRDYIFDGSLLRWFVNHPGRVRNSQTIAMGPELAASLTGDDLNHPIVLAARSTNCALVSRERKRDVVILLPNPLNRPMTGFTINSCLPAGEAAYEDSTGRIYVSR